MGSILRIAFLLFIISSITGNAARKNRGKGRTAPSPVKKTAAKPQFVHTSSAHVHKPAAARPAAPRTEQMDLWHDDTREETSLGHFSSEEAVFEGRPERITLTKETTNAYELPVRQARSVSSLINPGNLRDAVVLTEILGPPKARRRAY